MAYYYRGQPCSFVQMLGAYAAESTVGEVKTLGMMVGLISRHQSKLELSQAQRNAIFADTNGTVRVGEPARACPGTSTGGNASSSTGDAMQDGAPPGAKSRPAVGA